MLRFAALMHDVGKPRTRRFEPGGGVTFHHHEVVGAKITRKRMKALRFSNDETDAVVELVELHLRFHGYGGGEWTDSAVRRYVRDAGTAAGPAAQADPRRLHDAQPAQGRRAGRDVRRPRGAHRAAVRGGGARRDPPRPGRQPRSCRSSASRPAARVGRAYRHLLELRLDRGPMPPEEAEAALRAWYASADGA